MLLHEIVQRRDFLDILVALAQIVGSLATAGALWVTFKTLMELKRQTDLTNNPHLKLRFRILDNVSPKDIPSRKDFYDDELHDTWIRFITNNLDQDTSDLIDKYLFLEFSNAGKSEITEIVFDLRLKVEMFENDILGIEVNPTSKQWHRDIHVELDEKGKISMPITNVRYFPIYKAQVTNLKYKDVRGNYYTDYDGRLETDKVLNEILRPQRVVQPPVIDDLEDESEDISLEDDIPF